MKTLKIVLLLITLNTFTLKAQEFSLDTKESSIEWTGKAAFSSYSLTGSLKTADGYIKIENDTIVELSITVDMKSMHHKNNDLKSHLRGKDFFQVKLYPKANFSLLNPAVINNGKAYITGNMTIKNITKQEELTIAVNITKNTILLNLDCSLNRIDYGVNFNSPSFFKKMKDNAIADEFKLNGALTFYQ